MDGVPNLADIVGIDPYEDMWHMIALLLRRGQKETDTADASPVRGGIEWGIVTSITEFD